MPKNYSNEKLEESIRRLNQSERNLTQNEQRYRFLINATTSVYWTTDESGAFVEPQPSWEAYTGQPWKEHKGFGWTKMIHPSDVHRIQQVWQESCRTKTLYESWGRVWNAELSQYRYFEVRATPILNSDGTLSEWAGYIIDTTDRKEAEIGLRKARERLHQAQQMAKLGYWDWEISTNELTWSDEVYAIFGRHRDSFQPTVESFEACIHPDDYQRFLSERTAALAKNDFINIEHRIQQPDGSERYVHEIAKTIRNDDGEVVRVSGTVQDITQQKCSEDALKRSFSESRLRVSISRLFLTSPKSMLFNDIAGLMMDEFESRLGYLGYINDRGELFCPIAANEIRRKNHDKSTMLVDSKESWTDIIEACARDKRMIIHNNDSNFVDRNKSLRNALIAPMMVEKQLIGVIGVADKKSNYSDEDQKHMKSLSDFIAPIVKIYLDKELVQDQLESNAKKLKERNIALKVLIDNREDEKKKLSNLILQNFEQLVHPYFERINKCQDRDDMLTLLKIVEQNIHKSLSLLEKSYSKKYRLLTPTEVQVADMIKAGKMSKDIAEILNISPRTVFFHRENIRKN